METIVEYAQGLVYSLLCIMPSTYQKASLNALFGLFLEAQGYPLPQHTQVKSAASLSRCIEPLQLVYSQCDSHDSSNGVAAIDPPSPSSKHSVASID